MIQKTITTNLIKKEDLFNVLALAEAIQLPVLLIGAPGVAKTAAVIDYAKTSIGGQLSNDDLFLLETDEGTRSTAIKGNIDLNKLTTQNKFEVNSPITKAKFVVINEIDKASASLRNSLLGVMNEKMLFNGQEKKNCEWKTFVATCNEIPDDEKDSPFWDRFAITFHVDRLRESDVLDYYSAGGRKFTNDYKITLPEDGDAIPSKLDLVKLKKVIDVCYDKLSDRTLSFIPVLVANIVVVYSLTPDRAMIKAVELLVGKETSNVLAKSIMSKELRQLYDHIDMISACSNDVDYRAKMNEINKIGGQLLKDGKLSEVDQKDIEKRAEEQQDKLKFLSDESEEEEVLDNLPF